MHANYLEIVNLVIVFILLVGIIRVRGVMPMMWALFIYGTLHFSFGALALIDSGYREVLIRLHFSGGGFLANIAWISLSCVIFIMLAKDACQAHFRDDKGKKRTVRYILVTMLITLIGFLINLREGDWVQAKNIISMEACLLLMLLSFMTLKKFELFEEIKGFSFGLILLLMFLIIDLIAFYEVFEGTAWASAVERSGEVSFRASSVLFNPNLFGLWAALIYIACASGMYAYPTRRMMMLVGMILAAIALYLASSRSITILLIVGLLIALVLVKERHRTIPLLLLLAVWTSIYVISASLASILPINNNGWRSVALLGERLALIPVEVWKYAVTTVWFNANTEANVTVITTFQKLMDILDLKTNFGLSVGSEGYAGAIRSIEGRLTGGDSGWRLIYQDAGLFGLSGAVLGSCILVLWSIRAYLASKSTQTVYIFVTLIFCLFSGFIIRVQQFPVWVFIGLAMLLCIVSLHKTKIQPYNIGSIKI